MKQSKAQVLQQRIKEYNENQIKEREHLPNLIEAIKLVKQGDISVLDMYFYGYKEIERFPYEGKMQAYEVSKIKFWDKPLDIWLGHIKKRYTKATAIGEQGGFEGRKVSYKVNVSNFEESEIDIIWYEWLIEFSNKVVLENFVKETESKTLNAMRKYIRVGFQNYLKKVNNDKIQLERVRVDGKLYYVKNKQEEVFFEDIYVGQDDDGDNIHFLDIVGTQDTSGFNLSDAMFTSKKFIEENLEETLTKKQLEKWNMLIEHVKEYGIESIIDKYTGKIVKAKVQRVVYPDKEFKNIERVDSLVKIMNARMEKALDLAGVKYISLAEEEAKENPKKDNKSGEVTVYTGGFTEEEVEQYFQRHIESIYKAHVSGRLTWDKGKNGMLPSLENMNELPFDIYEKWVKGNKVTKIEIINEYYNKDKFKMKAGKKVIKKETVGVEFEDKNAKYITPEELTEIRRQAKRK